MSSQQKVEEQQLKIDGVNINFVKVGSGPQVLLFLPGTLGTWETDFGTVLREFNHEKYTMVCWDPPGYGKSRPFLRDFTTQINEDDAKMAHQLMQKLQIPRYVAVGWSEGGRVAYFLAALYPDCVEKVITWGTVVDIDQQTIDYFGKTANLDIWPKQQIDLMTEIYGRRYFEELWKRYVDSCYEITGASLGRHNLSKINQPVLVMYGSLDRIMGEKSAYYEEIANQLPNGRFVLLKGGNHGFHKQPQYKKWFQDTVDQFLAE